MIYLTIKVLKISCCPSKYTGDLCLSFLLNTVKYSFGWSGEWSGTGEISKKTNLGFETEFSIVCQLLLVRWVSRYRSIFSRSGATLDVKTCVASAPVIFCIKHKGPRTIFTSPFQDHENKWSSSEGATKHFEIPQTKYSGRICSVKNEQPHRWFILPELKHYFSK